MTTTTTFKGVDPNSRNSSRGAKSSGGREDLESSGLQRRNSSEASSGDFLDLKGEADIHGEYF
nr:hematological and neurological expressed 1 protein-like [Aotus nancymaae]